MKITSFFPNPHNGENFADILSRHLSSEEGEFFFVCAEYQRPGHNDELSDFKGLDVALTLNPDKSPIIFCSFMPESYFTSKDFSSRFHALMAKKRVAFMQIPFTPDMIVVKYKELIGDKKEEDLLAIEINRINQFEIKISTIRHDFGRYFKENSDYAKQMTSKAVTQAREVGLIGSEEEVIEQIMNFKHLPKNSVLAGKFFPGVFCDVEDTLLQGNSINQTMFGLLKNFSEEKPITLWTGGDIEKLGKILAQNGITWKLVSKYDLAGAEVEIAYDDEDFSVFFEKYGVKVKNFNKI